MIGNKPSTTRWLRIVSVPSLLLMHLRSISFWMVLVLFLLLDIGTASTSSVYAADVDLTPVSLQVKNTNLYRDESIPITLNAKNQGTKSSTIFVTARIFFSKDQKLDKNDPAVGDLSLTSIPAGKILAFQGYIRLSPSIPLGRGYLIVWIDYNNRLTEKDETNNIYRLLIQVVSRPDLIISAFSSGMTKVTRKLSFVIRTEVKNLGWTCGKTEVQFFLSKDSTLQTKGSGADVLLTKSGIPGLNRGRSHGFQTKITIPANATLGKHYLIAWADAGSSSSGIIRESNEKNNTRILPIEILSVARPDLIISALSSKISFAKPGSQLVISFSVANIGSAIAGQSTIELVVAKQRTPSSKDVLLKTHLLGSLSMGQSIQQSLQVTLPSTTPVGPAFIRATIDSKKAVSEADESNNARLIAFTVLSKDPDKDKDGYPESKDCDDNDKSIYPGAKEICDGKDNNCDKKIDDGQLCPLGTTCDSMQKKCVAVSKESLPEQPVETAPELPSTDTSETTQDLRPDGTQQDSDAGTSDVHPSDSSLPDASPDTNPSDHVLPDGNPPESQDGFVGDFPDSGGGEGEAVCEGGCTDGFRCYRGQCTENNCYFRGCSKGEVCLGSQCVPDPCLGVTCPKGEFCRMGRCVQSCATRKCSFGKKCRDGFCVVDLCFGVTCQQKQICVDGLCAKDLCWQKSCGPKRVCEKGKCIDDLCANIRCPRTNERCVKGQCLAPLPSEPVEEVSIEKVPVEEPRQEMQQESTEKDIEVDLAKEFLEEIISGDSGHEEEKPAWNPDYIYEKKCCEVLVPGGGGCCQSSTGTPSFFFFLSIVFLVIVSSRRQ